VRYLFLSTDCFRRVSIKPRSWINGARLNVLWDPQNQYVSNFFHRHTLPQSYLMGISRILTLPLHRSRNLHKSYEIPSLEAWALADNTREMAARNISDNCLSVQGRESQEHESPEDESQAMAFLVKRSTLRSTLPTRQGPIGI
jgi:hypothetical protein